MQFMSTKTIGEINLNDVVSTIANILRQDTFKKTAFIFFIATLLTGIVIQSGTSYTPAVDVFVYSFVYSAWITVCLPWLVQHMTGKLLGMLLGVFIRLFAVDLGVLAWSAFRGHRNILQRGLRMRPLFEPSMSWLAEAGYNLRYGVILSAIVASAISILIDFYEKLSIESKNSKKQTKVTEKDPYEIPALNKPNEESVVNNRNLPQQLRVQEWNDQGHTESKLSKLGTSVRFNTTGADIAVPMSVIGGQRETKEEQLDTRRHLQNRTFKTESEDDRIPKELNKQEHNLKFLNEARPKSTNLERSAWKSNENVRNPQKEVMKISEIHNFSGYSEFGNIGIVNTERISGVDHEKGETVQGTSKGRDKKTETVESLKGKVIRVGEVNFRRDHGSDTQEDGGKTRLGRPGMHKEAMKAALNESLRCLKRLKGKI